jgi:imidazole glycerol-phosphate synthase subunit HisH
MNKVIAIVDYGMGNVQSICNVLEKLKYNVILTKDRDEILKSDALILPGVGAFKNAMAQLKEDNLKGILKEYVESEKPLLGICLGMQLLFNESDEFGLTKGLGFIEGRVEKFSKDLEGKLPHISWNNLKPKSIDWDNSIFNGVEQESDFYFVHSYICKPKNSRVILSETEYGGIEFCSAVQKNNIYGCQFHPEKSAENGIRIVENFLRMI